MRTVEGMAEPHPRNQTKKDVAETLGVQLRTVTNWIASGCPSEIGPDGRRLLDLTEVRQWRLDRESQSAPTSPGSGGKPTLAQAELARKLTIAKRNELALAAERGLKGLGLADEIRAAETHDDLLAYTKEVTALVSAGLLSVARGNAIRSLVAQVEKTLTTSRQLAETTSERFAMGSPEAIVLMEAWEWIICPERRARVHEYVLREAQLDAEEYPNVDLTENPPELRDQPSSAPEP